MTEGRPKSVTLMLRWMEIKSNFIWRLWVGPVQAVALWQQTPSDRFVAFGREGVMIDRGPYQSLEDAQKASESAVVAWSKREPKVKP